MLHTPHTPHTPHVPSSEAVLPADVLLIEDDPGVADALRAALEGYDVRHADSAAAARRAVAEQRPDLILLDLSLPDAEGLVLLGDLKERAGVPILVCSARPRDPNAVLSLRLGAEDFIAKPFVVEELEARIAGVLRRTRANGGAQGAAGTNGAAGSNGAAEELGPSGVVRVGELLVNQPLRRMELGGAPLNLTPTEYRLLEALALRAGATVPREELGQAVWGTYDAAIGKAIDVHVTRLRAKLSAAANGSAPVVAAVRGFGFVLAPDSAS